MRFIVIILCIFVTSEACQMHWTFGKSAQGCILIDGQKREFRYFMPLHAKKVALPLLIGLHGGGGKPKTFEKYSRFTEWAKKSESFIVIYPKAIDKHWADGRTNLQNHADDVKFISTLIDKMPHTEKGEVYVVGMSNGGVMTQRLACEQSSALKGIAVVAATMSQELQHTCKATKALKSLFIFGSEDTSFLANGTIVSPLNQHKVRGQHIGIYKTLHYWKRRNSCKGTVVKKEKNVFSKKWGKYKDDGTRVIVHTYKDCREALKFYQVVGGGHRWPDTQASNGFLIKKAFNVGTASHEINTAEEIIDFFQLIKR